MGMPISEKGHQVMMRMILPRKKSPSPQRRRHRVVPTPPQRQNLPTTIFLAITRRRDGTSRVGGLERDKKGFIGWVDFPIITNPYPRLYFLIHSAQLGLPRTHTHHYNTHATY